MLYPSTCAVHPRESYSPKTARRCCSELSLLQFKSNRVAERNRSPSDQSVFSRMGLSADNDTDDEDRNAYHFANRKVNQSPNGQAVDSKSLYIIARHSSVIRKYLITAAVSTKDCMLTSIVCLNQLQMATDQRVSGVKTVASQTCSTVLVFIMDNFQGVWIYRCRRTAFVEYNDNDLMSSHLLVRVDTLSSSHLHYDVARSSSKVMVDAVFPSNCAGERGLRGIVAFGNAFGNLQCWALFDHTSIEVSTFQLPCQHSNAKSSFQRHDPHCKHAVRCEEQRCTCQQVEALALSPFGDILCVASAQQILLLTTKRGNLQQLRLHNTSPQMNLIRVLDTVPCCTSVGTIAAEYRVTALYNSFSIVRSTCLRRRRSRKHLSPVVSASWNIPINFYLETCADKNANENYLEPCVSKDDEFCFSSSEMDQDTLLGMIQELSPKESVDSGSGKARQPRQRLSPGTLNEDKQQNAREVLRASPLSFVRLSTFKSLYSSPSHIRTSNPQSCPLSACDHSTSDMAPHSQMLLSILLAAFHPLPFSLLSAAVELDFRTTNEILRSSHRFAVAMPEVEGSNASGSASGSTSLGSGWGTFWKIRASYAAELPRSMVERLVSDGHCRLSALFLKHCANKSIAVDHPAHPYLHKFGPHHFRRSTRLLYHLLSQEGNAVRKIDETANIKHFLPRQLGYVAGLQEFYARRVGLGGMIPAELGQLSELRVLSMGNNRLTGCLPETLSALQQMQRIVLHQNNLCGAVPDRLGSLGCIVNLAGNCNLHYGEDVPLEERRALGDLYHSTRGHHWTNQQNWITSRHVATWYKVGVLCSHVHSLVMSSNNMDGALPRTIKHLCHLKMIELATMPGLTGSISPEVCSLQALRRLCICRCGLVGPIPDEIGQLVLLEELQLFGNKLSGQIPDSLGRLVQLKLLSLGEYTGGNNFTPGQFPAAIEHLVLLEALFLADCRIYGPLPSWLGNLRALRQLDLQKNFLTGPLPESIGQLKQLSYFNVKDNVGLCGALPLRALGSLDKLNRLSLVHCSFEDPEGALEFFRDVLPRCKVWI